jgi:hypothetical protein
MGIAYRFIDLKYLRACHYKTSYRNLKTSALWAVVSEVPAAYFLCIGSRYKPPGFFKQIFWQKQNLKRISHVL